MHQKSASAFSARQHGAALLVFMLIAVLTAVSLLLNRLPLRSSTASNQATMQALALAKDALIGWSASHGTTPGMLPCPENTALIGTSSEGTAQTTCSNLLPSVGRLPWRTLKLPQLRDDTGEPLWYALSPGFRASPINGNSAAGLTVDGAANSAVAVIFSPGAPIASQNRPTPTSTTSPDIAQYLDGINNDAGTTAFTTIGASGLFNDRLLSITRESLFNAVNRRILAELRGDEATGLVAYYSAMGNIYPWAAADSAGVPVASQLTPFIPHTELTPFLSSAINTTLNNNGWYPLINYSVIPSRQQVTLSIAVPTSATCTITPSQALCQ